MKIKKNGLPVIAIAQTPATKYRVAMIRAGQIEEARCH